MILRYCVYLQCVFSLKRIFFYITCITVGKMRIDVKSRQMMRIMRIGLRNSCKTFQLPARFVQLPSVL